MILVSRLVNFRRNTGFGDYSYYYPYSYYDNNGHLSVERADHELAELGYYYSPVDGTIGHAAGKAVPQILSR
jgi:hypothetical protein